MIRIILCLCFIVSSLFLSGCSDIDKISKINGGNPHSLVESSKYEIFLVGGQFTYTYYVNDYSIEDNWIVITEYVEDGPYADSTFVHTNRLMLPAGITVIESRK
jgi:thioredoxin-related protein